MSIQSKVNEYIKKLSGPAYIEELFPDDFVQRHSKAESIKEILSLGDIVDQKTFDDAPAELFDLLAKKCTDFKNWEEMFTAAAKELVLVRQQRLRNREKISKCPSRRKFSLIKVDVQYHGM